MLSHISERLTRGLGSTHPSILYLRLSLIASKLRDAQYDSVPPMVEDLISSCRPSHESGSPLDSFAIRELEQALLVRDQRANSLDNCASIILICNNPPSGIQLKQEHVISGRSHTQEPAVPPKEATAKIDELTGAPEERAMWLRRSAGIARALWGDCKGYRRVVERLAMVLRSEERPSRPGVWV